MAGDVAGTLAAPRGLGYVPPPVPRTVVVIPTYNERANIPRIIPEVLRALDDCHVLIVDDESPDGTADLVAELAKGDPRIHLARHSPKMGIGPAYKEGFRIAIEMQPEFIIQMDADMSHPPDMLPRLVQLASEYNLVLGSRYIGGISVVNWPIERLLLSYFGNLYVRKVLGLTIQDATGGFKCWQRSALEGIHPERVKSNGYAFQIETSYRAWRNKQTIREVPILFVDRTEGDSKMNRRIGMEALWIVWWLKLAGMLGRL